MVVTLITIVTVMLIIIGTGRVITIMVISKPQDPKPNVFTRMLGSRVE